MAKKSLGQVAYEATGAQGPFSKIPSNQQAAWEAAAAAVLAEDKNRRDRRHRRYIARLRD